MWAYPQQGSFKMKLREVYKDHGRFKSQAKTLQKWIHKEFEKEKQLDLFNSYVFPWLCLDDELDLVEFG